MSSVLKKADKLNLSLSLSILKSPIDNISAWLGIEKTTSHYLNQLWLILLIYASLHLNEYMNIAIFCVSQQAKLDIFTGNVEYGRGCL